MRSLPRMALRAASVATVAGAVLAWTGGAGIAQGQAQGPSAATQALLKDAIVLDDHVHLETSVFHQGLDPWKHNETGLFDYARAKQGGLNVVVHAIYTEDAYNNYNYGVKQALRLIETTYQLLDNNKDKMEVAFTSADVRRIVKSGKMAVILALEGNPDTEGDLKVLQLWYRLGIRMIQLTSHDTTNALLDAYQDEHKWKGLSDKGRAFIREMNRLGIIVDPSHASEEATAQVIEANRAPTVLTHNGLISTGSLTTPQLGSYVDPTSKMPFMRLTPELYKALAAKGGLLSLIQYAVDSKPYANWVLANPQPNPAAPGPDENGVFLSYGRRMTTALPNKGMRAPDKDYGAYITALDKEMDDNWSREAQTDRRGTGYGTPWRTYQTRYLEAGVPMPTVKDWVGHAEYAIKLEGDDHVGIGLDLMSRPIMKDFDASKYWQFAEEMLAKNMSPTTVKKVLGENFLRVLDQAKVAGIEAPPMKAR